MWFRFLPFIVSLFLYSSMLSGQTDCLFYYESCDAYEGKRYEYDENTASFYLSADKEILVEFEAFQGILYTVSICTDSISLPLKFTIEDADSTELYNNSNDNYASGFEFSVPNNKSLNIRVSIDNDCVENVTICSGCVGVIIRKAVKPRTGF